MGSYVSAPEAAPPSVEVVAVDGAEDAEAEEAPPRPTHGWHKMDCAGFTGRLKDLVDAFADGYAPYIAATNAPPAPGEPDPETGASVLALDRLKEAADLLAALDGDAALRDLLKPFFPEDALPGDPHLRDASEDDFVANLQLDAFRDHFPALRRPIVAYAHRPRQLAWGVNVRPTFVALMQHPDAGGHLALFDRDAAAEYDDRFGRAALLAACCIAHLLFSRPVRMRLGQDLRLLDSLASWGASSFSVAADEHQPPAFAHHRAVGPELDAAASILAQVVAESRGPWQRHTFASPEPMAVVILNLLVRTLWELRAAHQSLLPHPPLATPLRDRLLSLARDLNCLWTIAPPGAQGVPPDAHAAAEVVRRRGRVADSCDHCRREARTRALQRCARCRVVFYCGRECQSAAWVAGHRYACFVNNPAFVPPPAAQAQPAPAEDDAAAGEQLAEAGQQAAVADGGDVGDAAMLVDASEAVQGSPATPDEDAEMAVAAGDVEMGEAADAEGEAGPSEEPAREG
ncbi:hypothetical protein DFJ74DRAFT_674881 [Hyaloraphidium curvatum]|nr:hypothetical protein DFJ74DRAFT_674881 [Hyaloraphidium curvatum]